MAPILGYWDVRGIAQPIRFMLAYLEVKYEEKLYDLTTPPHSREEWLAVKNEMDLDFPNLPYWKDGDVKMTESKAILRHVARVYDTTNTLLPKDPVLAYKTDMLETIVVEVMMGLAMFAYGYEESKEEETLKSFNEKLKAISVYLGNNNWLTGDRITFVDFWLYEALIWYTKYKKNFLEPYANFQEFIKRFEELPMIKKYMNQPNYIKGPCISPVAIKKI